jgi:predicted membrane channel-forming protein YqfA (hemolysin III family)
VTVVARARWLIGSTLVAVALALFLPAMPQPAAYHHFADTRGVYAIANVLDVVSNLAFAGAGLACLMVVLRAGTCFATPAERWPYLLFAVGVLLTAAGSSYYHLQPTNERLFWDRLPMTIAFMALIAAQIVDRVAVRAGLLALVPMVLVGVGTAVYWIVTERLGRGNVVPYAVMQAWAVIVVLQLAALYPSRYTHADAICAVFALYLLAKLFEQFDAQIFERTGLVGGHTLKHLAAAAAAMPVVVMLWRRRIASPTASLAPTR